VSRYLDVAITTQISAHRSRLRNVVGSASVKACLDRLKEIRRYWRVDLPPIIVEISTFEMQRLFCDFTNLEHNRDQETAHFQSFVRR